MTELKNDLKHALRVILAVVAVILFVDFVLIPPLPRPSSRARVKAAITQISALSTALDLFKVDMGHYPAASNGLQDLVIQPAGTTNWQQYLEKVPPDPWGNPYRYEYPGKHVTNSYDLSSAGPDGKFGTEDDISNW